MTGLAFRTRTLLAVFGVAAVTLAVAAIFISVSLRTQLLKVIENNLLAEARLASELASERPTDGSVAALDALADQIGSYTAARVTLIARDGTVVGDSAQDLAAIPRMQNHGTRPEVVAARRSGVGVGVERRHSATLGTDMLYVAVALDHPHFAVVRLALPLTDVYARVAAVRNRLLVALAVPLVSALLLAWLSSIFLARRVDAIASAARRYADGDFSRPVLDQSRDELGTVARVMDDTASELGRRMAEIGRERSHMEAILGGMVEGVLVVDSDGRITLVNDAARRLLHLDGAARGRHHLDLIRHPDVSDMLARTLETRAPESVEVSPLREPSRTFVARAAPLSSQGSDGALLVLHDITDLRQADRMRRDFVANVSHELRTPLTAIQGYVEALLDEDPPEPAEADRFLGIIARHAHRMERLVRDLLRLARLEAGQEPVERVPCRCADIFAAVVTDLEATIEDRRQRVTTRVDPGAAALVTDPAKLQDALRNLVENAVAYTPEGTTIELVAERHGDAVTISVLDEGPGIPEADLARIFERFYRVDKARSRESGGTGLGLSIVKHLVERMGGEVQASNRPGRGAAFTMTLPAVAPAVSPAAP